MFFTGLNLDTHASLETNCLLNPLCSRMPVDFSSCSQTLHVRTQLEIIERKEGLVNGLTSRHTEDCDRCNQITTHVC